MCRTHPLANARTAIDHIVHRGVELGKVSAADADAVLARLHTSSSLEVALEAADFVIEAVPERIDLKLAIFAEVDRLTAERTILATNTSALSITELAGSTRRPATRCRHALLQSCAQDEARRDRSRARDGAGNARSGRIGRDCDG